MGDSTAQFNGQSDNDVTVRLLVQGKEIFSLVRDNGEGVRQIRAESGAKISISDGTVFERVITITDSMDSIYKAVSLIAEAFEKYSAFEEGCDLRKNPVCLKILIAALHCGSLIGKGGAKIKELRDSTGAGVQIGDRTLPGSAERIVNIYGDYTAIARCVCQIATIIASPGLQKGSFALYDPSADDVVGPILFSDGVAYTVQGNTAIPVTDPDTYRSLLSFPDVYDYLSSCNPGILSDDDYPRPGGDKSWYDSHPIQTDSMWVPGDLIGCIIGKLGSKIAEIRYISGASIHIAIPGDEDREVQGIIERKVTIQGTLEAIALARYLITMCVELQKAAIESEKSGAPQLQVDPSLSLVQILTKSGLIDNNTDMTNPSELIKVLGISTKPERRPPREA